MTNSSDPFIKDIRKLCMHDKVMNQLIANTISWADVPSDDDILELEGWRSYQVVKQRAKSAYHRTVRNEKRTDVHRQTVKHAASPQGRTPYQILKQTRTKNVLLANGRVSPIKESVDIVYQAPVEYEELEIVEVLTIEKPIEKHMDIPLELPVQMPMESPTKTPVIEPTIVPPVKHTPVKRPSKEKLNKKEKKIQPTVKYQPTFIELYVNPYLGYIMAVLLVVMLYSMKI